MNDEEDYRLFVDCWRLFRQCTDTYDWDRLTSICSDFWGKHSGRNKKLAQASGLAILDEVERRENNENGKMGGTT